MIKNIKNLTEREIESVYSGKPNRCCCICHGKYYKAPNRMVKKVFRILKNANAKDVKRGYNYFSTVYNGRLYVAYYYL